jgi:hypothetical protein
MSDRRAEGDAMSEFILTVFAVLASGGVVYWVLMLPLRDAKKRR